MAALERYYSFSPENAYMAEGPWTDPALQANLVLRVLLGMLAVLLLVVPTRLLWRNGEFAAAAFCVVLSVLNVYWFINALVWRDDYLASWWPGYGWCDLQAYTAIPLQTAENGCIFEIMRGMYYKISLNRATGLTRAEKVRGQLMSAAIILSVPVLQVALTYEFLQTRYNVSTLIGCGAVYVNGWPTILVYLMPVNVFSLGAFGYAVAIYLRFRALDKTAREALANTNNSDVTSRQNKIRRKLYLMCACIIGPYVPLQLALFVFNVQAGLPWMDPFDPRHPDASVVSLTQSAGTPWALTNHNYINVLTAVPVFLIFGTTPDAVNMYREALLAVGLGRLFPGLREPYEENRRRGNNNNNNHHKLGTLGTGNGNANSTRPDDKALPVREPRWPETLRSGEGEAQLPPRKTFLIPDLGAMWRSINILCGRRNKVFEANSRGLDA